MITGGLRLSLKDAWNLCRFGCGLRLATSQSRRKHERAFHGQGNPLVEAERWHLRVQRAEPLPSG